MVPTRDQAENPDVLPAPPSTPAPDIDALATVTAQIQADAHESPELYLTDTLVPNGGE